MLLHVLYGFVYTCHILELLLLCTVLLLLLSLLTYCVLLLLLSLLLYSALLQLLLFIVCRMTNFVAVSSHLILAFLSHSNTICFKCSPWQHCRNYSADVLYARAGHLRACAEPRRALARHGGTHLVLYMLCFSRRETYCVWLLLRNLDTLDER